MDMVEKEFPSAYFSSLGNLERFGEELVQATTRNEITHEKEIIEVFQTQLKIRGIGVDSSGALYPLIDFVWEK